ncbi:hypothetical protein KAR91_68140 [Candidatus Pacearchaeota archaeon]|nr:hypothetical protein [Candidatus Pacearchaeota archaeon]
MLYRKVASGETEMDRQRYIDLDRELVKLTKDERKAGWHFCYDWDEMLIGPGTPEAAACLCGVIKKSDIPINGGKYEFEK